MTNARQATSRDILHVVAGEDYGGASVVIAALAEAATRSGFRTAVLTTERRLAGRLQQCGIPAIDTIAIRRTVHPVADVVAIVRLTRHLRRHRYDIVHTHTSKGGLVGRLAARLAGTPLIVHTVHGFGFHGESSRLRRRVVIVVERLLSHVTDLVVTVTDHHRELALSQRIAPPRKIVTIRNGVEDPAERLPSEGCVAPDGHPRKLVVLCHGRLCTQKGIVHLVRAMSLLPTPLNESCRLQIVGEGELAGELAQEVTRLGIGPMVEFLGFRDDPLDLVHAADVVVLPSLWEGLSISLLEALALGKPVVATAIPSNVEVVGDSGSALLVPPADPGALAKAMIRLLDDEEQRTALSRAARKRYESEFTATRMCEAYLALYRKAMRDEH